MVNLDDTIKHIDMTVSQLTEYKSESKSNLNLTIGIVYGLVIGFFCSLSATIIYEEWVKSLYQPWNLLVKLVSPALLLFFLLIGYREFKSSEQNIQKNEEAIRLLKDCKKAFMEYNEHAGKGEK